MPASHSIIEVSSESPILASVVALADRNSKYLGHFPASCFAREADRKRVLAAVTSTNHLAGYVLYRTAHNRAVIQQLCVSDEYRRAGVARALIQALKERVSRLDGIALHCAREFADAHVAWQRLGFVAVDEKPGRGRSARPLTRFWLDFRKPDLWTTHRAETATDTLVAVIDANIAFDLQDPSRCTAQQSLALTEDWLEELVSLWVTDELFNEVDRHTNADIRRRRKGFLRSFPKIDASHDDCRRIVGQLSAVMSHGNAPSEQSDLIQIATAIGGGADAFVTQDTGILAHSQAIEDQYGLRVLRPAELIVDLDELTRSHDFAPARLAGTPVIAQLVTAGSLDRLCGSFINHQAGEKKHEFASCLHGLVSLASRAEVTHLSLPDNESVALLGMCRSSEQSWEVKILRVRDHRNRATLVRLLVGRAVQRALEEGADHVCITDTSAGAVLDGACIEMGFVPRAQGFSKFSVRHPVAAHDAIERVEAVLRTLSQGERPAAELILTDLRVQKPSRQSAAMVERSLWPGVIRDSPLPSFIVPVQPQYAAAMFDTGLASQRLLGVDPELMFKCEHVYYKSSHAPVVVAPSRVLWYVSADRDDQVRRIRGYSQVIETTIDDAKTLFRQFKRLGVYEWRDVTSIAARHPRGQLMAIRFGPTRIFEPGVSRKEMEGVFSAAGQAVPPMSTAVEVSSAVFERLYDLGGGALS